MRYLKTVAAGLGALVIGGVLAGCGGSGGSADETAAAAPSVDSRYATAEALLAYSEALLNREPSDVETWIGLFYWETPKQEQIRDLMNVMLLPTARFQAALADRFGADAAAASVMPGMKMKDTTITSNDGARVEATFTDGTGEQNELRLVKVGDRWWISGYTIEYDPDFIADTESDMSLDQLLELSGKLAGLGPAIDQITARVRAGEFGSAPQAQAAYQGAFYAEVVKVGMQEVFESSGGG